MNPVARIWDQHIESMSKQADCYTHAEPDCPPRAGVRSVWSVSYDYILSCLLWCAAPAVMTVPGVTVVPTWKADTAVCTHPTAMLQICRSAVRRP